MSLPAMPTITAFANSPDRGRGLARDTRVRWALEEVGLGWRWIFWFLTAFGVLMFVVVWRA